MRASYAVITGASAGIGEEFARRLAEEGYPLILVARRRDRLLSLQEELRKFTSCEIFCADLSRREECERLVQWLLSKKVSIFINNAGFGDCGFFAETDLDKELKMIDVNVKAVHFLTKHMLKRFQKQKGGYLLNVASSAGLIPAGPYMAAYYATKAYVASFTRAIARELKEKRIPVYIGALCPGPVDTEFNQVAGVEFALKGISVEDCVSQAIRGMKRGQVVIVPSLRMKAAIFFGRFLPQSLYISLTGHQQKKKLKRC